MTNSGVASRIESKARFCGEFAMSSPASHGPLERLFVLLSATILVSIGICLLFELFASEVHSIFSILSLLMFFVASAIITLLSFFRSISGQLFAVSTNIYFLSRVPILYLFPDHLDYQGVLLSQYANFEKGGLFVVLASLFFLVGQIFPYTSQRTKKRRLAGEISQTEAVATFRVFGLKIALETVVKSLFPILCILLVFQIYSIFVLNLGLTGGEYARESAAIVRVSQLLPLFLPFVVYSSLAMSTVGSETGFRIAIASIIVVGASFVLLASRASVISFLFALYCAARFMGTRATYRQIVIGLMLLGLAVLVYPLISTSRLILIGVSVNPFQGYEFPLDQLAAISNRVGTSFESFFLWFKLISEETVRPDYSVFVRIAELINSLVPGDLIEVSPYISVAKLQTMYGRFEVDFFSSAAYLEGLGGHGENPGQLGMAYILFGMFMPGSFFVIGALSRMIELSSFSPFWKFILIPSIIAGSDPLPSVALFTLVLLLYMSVLGLTTVRSISKLFRPIKWKGQRKFANELL
ncbi:MAG: hypothetical protein KKE83_12990 [Proteobacteria bacterium]|nr:hypothetical protein [Pseudomonadota bacterium]